MLARVFVHSQDDFVEWLQSAGDDEDVPLPELGERLYQQQQCFACHTIDGSAGIGPTFKGIYGSTETMADGEVVQVDENYLRESILEPGARIVQGYQNIMPNAYGSLTERQVSALIAFIQAQAE